MSPRYEGKPNVDLWASGTVFTYWPLDSEPLVFQPDPLREVPGVGSTLQVLLAPDGDHTWLVQPGFDDEPTLIELVNVVEFELARQMSTEIEGSWEPVGATVDGLVLTSDHPEPRTRLVATTGIVEAELEGTALSVAWSGVAIVRPDGSLIVTDARLGNPIHVEKPSEGEWVSVGGPVVPATSPQTRTGADDYLVMLADEPEGQVSAATWSWSTRPAMPRPSTSSRRDHTWRRGPAPVTGSLWSRTHP